MTLTLEIVQNARRVLRDFLPVTPLRAAAALGPGVYLKLEGENPTGSFKPRGALHAVWRKLQDGPVAGVVTSSTGNHGAGVAYAARKFNLPATVFLPENPNPVKRARIAALGATIIETGRDYDAARGHAARYAVERGWYFVEDGRDPNITPGPATIGLEIAEQLPAVDVIYVPVGDSTLIRGLAFTAKALKPGVRIVGVQAERAPAYYRSWKEKRLISTETADTIADGLAVRCPTEENIRALSELVDDMVLVSEEDMLRAVGRLLLDEHVVAEPSGAATTAAFLKAGGNARGLNVVLLVTGANLTPEYLRRAATSDS